MLSALPLLSLLLALVLSGPLGLGDASPGELRRTADAMHGLATNIEKLAVSCGLAHAQLTIAHLIDRLLAGTDEARTSEFGRAADSGGDAWREMSGRCASVAALTWADRSDDARPLWPSTCDRLVAEYARQRETLDSPVIRAALDDCVLDRIVVDAFRASSPLLRRVPQDLLTHPHRKYEFALELLGSAAVYWQHFRDESVPLARFLAADYQDLWRGLRLNVSHYARVTDQAGLDAHRASATFADYLAWNNAQQGETVVWAIDKLLDKLVLSPAQLDQAQALADGIIGQLREHAASRKQQ